MTISPSTEPSSRQSAAQTSCAGMDFAPTSKLTTHTTASTDTASDNPGQRRVRVGIGARSTPKPTIGNHGGEPVHARVVFSIFSSGTLFHRFVQFRRLCRVAMTTNSSKVSLT
ncbi:hypothetical protein GCM10027089_31380 [Nocardia thraciensis]